MQHQEGGITEANNQTVNKQFKTELSLRIFVNTLHAIILFKSAIEKDETLRGRQHTFEMPVARLTY